MKNLIVLAVLIIFTNEAYALQSRHYNRCTNYVANQLVEVFTASYARNKAREYCRDASLATIRFSFPKYNDIYTVDYAMKKSVQKAKQFDIRGRKTNFELAFDVYNETFSSGYALEKTFKNARKLINVDPYCLEDEFRFHRRTYGSTYAFDKSLKTCLDY